MTIARETSLPELSASAGTRTPLLLLVSNVLIHAEALRAILAARFPHSVAVSSSDACTPSYIAQDVPQMLLIDSSSVDGVWLASAFADVVISAPLVVYAISKERPDDIRVFSTLQCSGFVSRDASVEELQDVIQAVFDGEVRCPSWVTGLLVREFGRKVHVKAGADKLQLLTARQKEAVMLRAAGLSSKEAAKRMGISPKTVKNETHAGFQKLGVHSAREAAELLKVGVILERSQGTRGTDKTTIAATGP
jgi:DNA-binding NarL/FixJ family response regulator